MKLKPYLRSLANLVLCLSLLSLSLYVCSCSTQIEPTYKEKDIPSFVKQICKEEYQLDVTTQETPNTLWIYAPLPKIIHKDFGKNKDKFLDEEMAEKLRNMLTTIGRVILSADKTPEFYCLVASDINIGIDYILTGNALDIKKSYAGFIPWPEANRRYVIDVRLNTEAISDTTGSHIQPYEIKMEDFLARQIAQRIHIYLQEEENKKYFQVEKMAGSFYEDTFSFEYAIKQLQPPKIDIKKEMLNIASYVMQTYEFDKFLMVEIKDLNSQDKLLVSRARLKELKLF
jgi:hypothetical protein